MANSRLREPQVKVLRFVAEHPGGRRVRAFPFGFGYRFEAPELKRAPFRAKTLGCLIDQGYVLVTGGIIKLSAKGQAALNPQPTKDPS